MSNPTAAMQAVSTHLLSPENIAKIRQSLPRHLSAERMARLALNLLQRDENLQEVAQTNPASIYKSVLAAADLGLELNGPLGHAYIVPFWNKKLGKKEAVCIPGYKGLIQLATRSEQVSRVEAEVVYENDVFEAVKGDKPYLKHRIDWFSDRGKMIGAYAIAFFKDGGTQFEVMSKEQIDAIMRRSPSWNTKHNKAFGPWDFDYNAMARKTPVRSLIKWLPVAIDLPEGPNRALSDDEAEYIDTTASAVEVPRGLASKQAVEGLEPEPEEQPEASPTDNAQDAEWQPAEPEPEPEPKPEPKQPKQSKAKPKPEPEPESPAATPDQDELI